MSYYTMAIKWIVDNNISKESEADMVTMLTQVWGLELGSVTDDIEAARPMQKFTEVDTAIRHSMASGRNVMLVTDSFEEANDARIALKHIALDDNDTRMGPTSYYTMDGDALVESPGKWTVIVTVGVVPEYLKDEV